MTGHFLGPAETPQPNLPSKPAESITNVPIQAADTDSSNRRRAGAIHYVSVTHHEGVDSGKPTVITVRRGAPHHAPIHQPQRSQTLMRHGVTPPAPSLKRKAKL